MNWKPDPFQWTGASPKESIMNKQTPPRRNGLKPSHWLLKSSLLGLLLLILAILIPASPIHISLWFHSTESHEGKTSGFWAAGLDSPDDATREKSIVALGFMPETASAHAKRLGQLLSSEKSDGLRLLVSQALSKMSVPSVECLPDLVKALNDEEMVVRANVARCLLRLGPATANSFDSILAAVQNRENQTYAGFTTTIQETLILVLGRAISGSAPQQKAIGEALLVQFLEEGPTNEIKNSAIRALGMAGNKSQTITTLIQTTANQAEWPFVQDAEEALAQLGAGGLATAPPAKIKNELILPEAERIRIWDIEHQCNILIKDGFGPFSKALAASDKSALVKLFSPTFKGKIASDKVDSVEIRQSFSVKRQGPQSASMPPVDGKSFVNDLISFRALFGKTVPSIKMAMTNLSPFKRDDLNGLFEGRGQLRLYGLSEKGGPIEVVAMVRLVLQAPTRTTMAKGAWIQEAEILEVSTALSQHPLFVESATKRGLNTGKLYDHWTADQFLPITGGIQACDFDHDGWLDLLVTDINGGKLYRGGQGQGGQGQGGQGQGEFGGSFTDVTDSMKLTEVLAHTQFGAWVDIDQDGFEDLILEQTVLRNDQGRGFTNMTSVLRPRIPEEYINIVVGDYDKDGLPDLYFTRTGRPGGSSWLEGQSDDHRTNILYRNLGGWRFENTTFKAGIGGNRLSTFTAAWLDADNDGWPDLHVPNEFGDGTLFFNNKDGTFRSASLANRPVDFGTMGLAAGDLNNDGLIDLYCSNMYSKAGTRVLGNLELTAFPPKVMDKMRQFVAGSQIHLNQGKGQFSQAGKSMHANAVGWAYGVSLADLDNDGWLDIYANAGYCSKDRTEPDG